MVQDLATFELYNKNGKYCPNEFAENKIIHCLQSGVDLGGHMSVTIN